MKQRACIAIAICLRPKVIIADEPTSALDVVVQRQVMATLARVQQELGAAVVLVGHDMGLMAQFVDRLGVMYAGRLVEVAPIGEIITSPKHPYTQMLIASLPSLERKGMMQGIPGLAPLLRDLPPGCAFHPRCPLAVARCRAERPELRGSGGRRSGRVSSCVISRDGSARGAPRHQDLRRWPAGSRQHSCAGGFLPGHRLRSSVGYRHRRRERQRQDDAGTAVAGPRRADIGSGAVSGARPARPVRHGTPRIPPRHPGDLPGPVRRLQSVLPGGSRAHHAGCANSVLPGPRPLRAA